MAKIPKTCSEGQLEGARCIGNFLFDFTKLATSWVNRLDRRRLFDLCVYSLISSRFQFGLSPRTNLVQTP